MIAGPEASGDVARVRSRMRFVVAGAALLSVCSYLAFELGLVDAARIFGWLGALGLVGMVAGTAGIAATHAARRYRYLAAAATGALALRTAVAVVVGGRSVIAGSDAATMALMTLDVALTPGLIAAAAVAVMRPTRRGLALAGGVLALAIASGVLMTAPWVADTPLGPVLAYDVARWLRCAVVSAVAILAVARPPRDGPPPLLEPSGWVHAIRGAAPLAIGQALLLTTPLLVLIGPAFALRGDAELGLHTVARIVQALGLGLGGLGFVWLAAVPELGTRARFAAAGASALATAAWAMVGALDQLGQMRSADFRAIIDQSSLPFIGFMPGAGWLLALALFALALLLRAELRRPAGALLVGALATAALHVATPVYSNDPVGVVHLLLLTAQAALAALTWYLAARVRRVAQATALVTSFADDASASGR
ncbi:MAG: hypothetical protein U1F43_35635 [Myxococcota bacterium]